MKKAILCTENGLSLSLFVTSTGSVTELCSVTADHCLVKREAKLNISELNALSSHQFSPNGGLS